MKKKKNKKPVSKELKARLPTDAQGLLLIALGALALLALITFTIERPHGNWLGLLGYGVSLGTKWAFGLGSYLIPLYLFWWGRRLLRSEKKKYFAADHLYFFVLLGSTCVLLSIFAESFPDKAESFENKVITETLILQDPYPRTIARYNLGGVPFYFLFRDLPYLNLQQVLSSIGTSLIFSSLALVSFLLLTRARIFTALWLLVKTALKLLRSSFSLFKRRPPLSPAKSAPTTPTAGVYAGLPAQPPKESKPKSPIEPIPLSSPVKKIAKILSKPDPTSLKEAEKTQAGTAPTPVVHLPVKYDSSYRLPPPSLLSSPAQKVAQPMLKKDLKRQAEVLEETLKSFGIDAKVGEIHSGPSITSFEVHPSIGVKVQKIKALENDIALNLEAKSIRIVAPIPGKAAVGVEVPAIHPQEVSFRELLQTYQQQLQKGRKMQIPILLGKGVSGEPVFSDLSRMPHLLIAGATGSGKSVCINTIVLSILMNARPEEVRLLMVDPKKVELTQYSKLPHMIAPVITEAHGAYAALQWLVKEMQTRYEILKQLGLRNISAFNARKIKPDFESSLSIPIPAQLPYIIAMIDEFADLMMVSSADLETPIARIAQMARAVGIHLILATQRPSREVITGIIKANIPCRIAFKVASRINSQIILDDIGAESLLGSGDCLFLPPGSSQLLRAQGAYISDDDINRVIQHLALQQPEPNYLIPSFDAMRIEQMHSGEEDFKGKDALYEQALSIVMQTKIASTTYLQRKLKIGYARAASLIDELEENGVIGPSEGSKPRRVLSNANAADLFDNEE